MDNISNAITKILAKNPGKLTLKDCLQYSETPEEYMARHAREDAEIVRRYNHKEAKRFLKDKSIYKKEGLIDKTYDDLDANSDPKFKEIARKTLGVVHDYVNGDLYNIILTGEPGAGKSLLASCMLNKINQSSDLKVFFVSIIVIKDLILSQYKTMYTDDKIDKSRQLEEFRRSLEQCDVVVLDDLGSEAGMRREVSEASQSMQDELFDIGEKMEGKAVIITTNNSREEFQKMYNPKIISRLFTANPDHVFNFNGISDYRIKHN